MGLKLAATATFGKLVVLSLLAFLIAILPRSDNPAFFMFSTLLLEFIVFVVTAGIRRLLDAVVGPGLLIREFSGRAEYGEGLDLRN
jgi:hypothetical protein